MVWLAIVGAATIALTGEHLPPLAYNSTVRHRSVLTGIGAAAAVI